MRSGESLLKNPYEFEGQTAEGFENGKIPESITVDGVTFERGFTEEKTGNIFYTRVIENSTYREALLVDKQGKILKHKLPPDKDSGTIFSEQGTNDDLRDIYPQ
ncbi:MAG: hypothetical protein WDN47_01465 [Candidatus Doudnabacteria bacterium]